MKIGWLAALGTQILVILGFWAWNNAHDPMGNQFASGAAGWLLAGGRLAGLLAAFAILLQFILVGRVRWVERVFGLDRMFRLHHIVGFAVIVLLLAHPLLVTAGHATDGGLSWREQQAEFLEYWDGVTAATAGLVVMLVAIAFSVALVLKRIRYEVWYATHFSFYAALALAFWHQIAVGGDFTGNPWFKGYWIALHVFVLANLVGYRFVRPLWLSARHRFTVARVEPETKDVASVHIEGRNLDRFRVQAGQFMLVRFLARGFRWESHPFSVSCRPDGRRIRLTIKQLGDFTRRIPDLKPGTRVIVDGPHGVFTAERCRSPKALLIAGGIGITPIRSLAEELARRGHDLILLYGNRNESSVVFRKELDDLAHSTGRLRVVYVMSDDAAWPGEKGRIDRALIERVAPDVLEREVFLCGPPPMMKLVRTSLVGLSVRPAAIHYERFAL